MSETGVAGVAAPAPRLHRGHRGRWAPTRDGMARNDVPVAPTPGGGRCGGGQVERSCAARPRATLSPLHDGQPLGMVRELYGSTPEPTRNRTDQIILSFDPMASGLTGDVALFVSPLLVQDSLEEIGIGRCRANLR